MSVIPHLFTSNFESMRTACRWKSRQLRFCVHLCVFWLPFLVLLFVFESTLWRHGEIWPIKRVVEHQNVFPNSIFLRQLFDQRYSNYHYLYLKDHAPDVVALGSSRTMMFRKEMFGDDAQRFRNAGGSLWVASDLNSFLDALPNFRPRVVIFGVDQWWLNADIRAPQSFSDSMRSEDPIFDWRGHVTGCRRFIRDPRAAELLLGSSNTDRIGLAARFSNAGFRSDGSWKLGIPAPTTVGGWRFVDRASVPHRIRIMEPGDHFAATKGVGPSELHQIRRGLMRLKERGCLVVGFAPPFSSESAILMKTLPSQSGLWSEYQERIPDLFRDLDLPFIDASTPSKLGLDDRYMSDGYHAVETLHLHLLLRMLADDRVHRALPSARVAVEKLLRAPQTNYFYVDIAGTTF